MSRHYLPYRLILVPFLAVALCLPSSLTRAAGAIDGEECTTDVEYEVQTSIGCVGGYCNGEMVIWFEQSSCKSKAGGGDCEESGELISRSHPPRPKFVELRSGLYVQAPPPHALRVQQLLLPHRPVERLPPLSLLPVGHCAQ
jgi:hypothetical protein